MTPAYSLAISLMNIKYVANKAELLFQGGFQLYVRVGDRDSSEVIEIVDHIYFNESPFPPGSQVTRLQRGNFQNGVLEARFSIRCSPNFSEEDCTQTSTVL